MNKWQCVVCGFIYDEAQGWPEEEQQRVASLVAGENARRLYRLDRAPTTTFGRPDARFAR